MKLVDKMKDENLGCAILYNFTKGYGHVPMNVYDIVLPLLYHDTFRNSMSQGMNVEDSLAQCKLNDDHFFDNLMRALEDDKEMTSKALGICLLNRFLSFEFENNEMKGIAQESKILDLNEAILLGEYFAGKSFEEIISGLKKNIKIVFLDSASLGQDIDLTPLFQFGKVDIFPSTSNDQILERIKDATVILTNKCVLSKEILQQSQAELICICATGTNNVDLQYCHDHHITVCNVSGYSTHSVAQHTFALLLALYNQLHYYHNYVEQQYCQSEMFCHIGRKFPELYGKTWGICGLGAIGRAVGHIAAAFGCKVIYYSTSGKNNNDHFQRVELDTLLQESDIISIHAPLTPETQGLFNAENLNKMKSTAYLINVARGGIIDEQALAATLKNHQLAGAALDVFEQEPISKHNPLLEIKDASLLLMTPHVAWATVEARNRLFNDVCQNITAYFEGKPRNVC